MIRRGNLKSFGIIFTFVFLVCFIRDVNCEVNDISENVPKIILESSRIIDENIAQAKNRAIEYALKRGVQEYLVDMVGPQAVADNLDRVVQEIMPKSRELVENYNIIAEQQIGEDYVVFVKVKVNQKLLKDRLLEMGMIQPEAEPIKLLFLVLEKTDSGLQYWWKNPDSAPPLSPAELVLYRVFQEKGFNPINRTLSIPESGYSTDMENAELDNSKALRWGQIFSADVVIWGQTEESPQGEVSVSLKAMKVEDGSILCQVSQIDQGGKEVFEHLLGRVVDRLSACMKEGLGRGGIEPIKFIVTLKGLRDYFQFKSFRDFISNMIPGVRQVKQRRIGSRFVSFQVEFLGSIDDFREAVMGSTDLPVTIANVEEGNNEIIFVLETGSQTQDEQVNFNDHTKPYH